jgi:hypothetical protein
MNPSTTANFDRQYQTHLKHLKLKGLQPKTIDAYARAIRRMGEYFDHQIDNLSPAQLTDYFSDLLGQKHHNTADWVPKNAQSGRRAIAMMAGNHRRRRARVIPRPLAGEVAEKIISEEVGLTGLVQQSVQIVASHDLTLLIRFLCF